MSIGHTGAQLRDSRGESHVPSVLRNIFGPRFGENAFGGTQDLKLPGSVKRIVEEYRQRYEKNGDEEILKFARKYKELARRQSWVKRRVIQLVQSRHEHEVKKARAFARIYGEHFDFDTT